MLLRRGDVAVVDFSPAGEGEANFIRPAIVVTNDIARIIHERCDGCYFRSGIRDFQAAGSPFGIG